MPISESLYILFNNINSQDFDIINIHIDSGLYQETFIPDRTIKETKVRNNPIPFFQGVEDSSRVINCSLAFKEGFDEDKLRSVKRWLTTSYYSPLIFSESPDYIYYSLCTNTSDLLHTGNGNGYINVEFQCDSNFVYSPVYTSVLYDFSINNLSPVIQFINNGDVDCKPMLSLQKVNDGNIAIINLSDGGKEFGLRNLLNNEDLYIDNENEEIVTSIPNTYRYDNQIGEFLNMKRGINNLQIFGDCKLQFRYQFKNL